MQKIKVIGRVLNIGLGAKLRLSKDQAAARAHALDVDKLTGIFTSTKTLQFKCGEVFEMDAAEIPKNMRDNVEIVIAPGDDVTAAPTKPPRKEKSA